MIRRIPGLAPACLSLLLSWSALAEDAHVLTLGQALERSLASNAGLAALEAELDAAQARARRESLAAPLSLGVELENLGTDGRETTVRLTRPIELGGKRQARQALGEAEVARARHQGQVSRREMEASCRRQFIEVLADQRRLQMARELLGLATRARDEVAAAVRSGRNPETDLHAAELALADAELELEHAGHELAAARVTLASIWGAREPDFGSVAGNLDELPAMESLELLAARLEQSPRQREARLAAQATAARRELARANARPDLSAALGVRRLEGFDDHALVMSVSMPLGTHHRASLEMREMEAHAQAQDLRRAQSLLDAYQQLYEQYQELLHSRAEIDTLRDRMLPGAARSLMLARRGFEAGRFPFQVLAQSQSRLSDLRRRQVEAAVRHHQLWIGIELLAPRNEEAAP